MRQYFSICAGLFALFLAAGAVAAITANSMAMSGVFSALRAAGIPERALQTSDFSVQPVYVQQRQDQGNEAARIAGYRVSNQVQVLVDDLSARPAR